jgi:hypothetical protein
VDGRGDQQRAARRHLRPTAIRSSRLRSVDDAAICDRPAVAPDVRTIQDRRNRIGGWGPGGDHNNFCPPWGADSRVWTGGWFDFPRYADLGNQGVGYDEGATSFSYTRFNRGGYLPGTPLPSNWRKLYPTTRLFQRSAFNDDAFIRIISEMSTLGVQNRILQR